MKHTGRNPCRKGGSASGRERRRRAGKALAAAGAIAGGTQGYADPVRFDNLPPADPGYFDWTTPNEAQTRRWLDLTVDTDAQPAGVGGAASFGQTRADLSPQGEVATVSGDYGVQAAGHNDYVCVGVAGGETIPGGFTWRRWARVDFGDPYGAATPEGEATYLGVRFDRGDGWHYGWIGVVRTDTQFDAFAWGYETEPGVPIAAGAATEIPVPAASELGLFAMSLGLLAAGAWVVKKRIPQPEGSTG